MDPRAAGERAGVDDLTDQLVLVGALDLDHESAVADVETVSGVDAGRQFLVVDLDHLSCGGVATDREPDGVAVLEGGLGGEVGGPNLGPGQIGQDADVGSLLGGDGPNGPETFHAVVHGPVGQVDPSYVHAGPNQAANDFGIVCGRAETRHKFRFSHKTSVVGDGGRTPRSPSEITIAGAPPHRSGDARSVTGTHVLTTVVRH